MDDGSRMQIGLIGCLTALILLGLLTACESAVVELSDAKLRKNAETDKRAKRLLKLVSKPNRLMTAASVSRAFMIASFSIVAQAGFFPPLVKLLTKKRFLGGGDAGYYVVCAAAFLIVIICSALAVSAIGIILPKGAVTCSEGKGEKFAYAMSGFFVSALALCVPVERLASAIVTVILRIFGVKNTGKKDAVTEEEILMMVDAVNETGGIEESQKEMINNIFEFGDLEIRDVMTHRTSIHAVELNAPISEAVKIATEDGFSRIPVYSETIDSICGVVFAKDLLKTAFSENSDGIKISDVMRDIMYIPETNGCGELFEEFTAHRNQIAVVVDEYGGTAGIVTMEDLIEAIVGSIQDEYDNEEEEIDEITPNTFDLSGTADFSEVMDRLGVDFPEENDYDTIGAFVIDLLGRYPEENERPAVEYKNLRFTVISAEEKKIEKLRAVKLKKQDVIQ